MEAITKKIDPTITAAYHKPTNGVKTPKRNVIRIVAPLTKFGADVVTVALIFVPNCSDAEVINTVHKPPIGRPSKNMII